MDFPCVDYVVQYDAPDDVREYIHRVGRTARGEAAVGASLLFLLPEEKRPFLLKLQEYAKAIPKPLKLTEKTLTSIAKIQKQLETILNSTPELKLHAHTAVKQFYAAYNSHSMKDVFRFSNLSDKHAVGKSFGLDTPPKIDGALRPGHKETRMQRNSKNPMRNNNKRRKV